MVARYRFFIWIGACTYVLWHFFFAYVASPGGSDSLTQRIVVATIGLGIAYWPRPIAGWELRQRPELFFFGLLSFVTLHAAYTTTLNQWNFAYSMGFLLTFAACCQFIEHQKLLIGYVLLATVAAAAGGAWHLVSQSAEVGDSISRSSVTLASMGTFALLSWIHIRSRHAQKDNELRLQRTLDQERAAAIHSNKMAALGEMSAGVAHEINNPLAVISLTLESLREALPQDQHASIDRIEKTVERISKIVKGLRAFARQSDDDPMVNTTVQTLLQEALDLVKSRFTNRSIQLTLDTKCDPATEIECRSYQIVQVLINLLANSMDSLSEIKRPGFVPEVSISTSLRGDRVLMRVRDNGLGIPESIRDRIMEPFFTTKPVGRGTGLGLSISRGIIEAHRGSIWLETPPPGSTGAWFVIELPLRVQRTQEDAAAA